MSIVQPLQLFLLTSTNIVVIQLVRLVPDLELISAQTVIQLLALLVEKVIAAMQTVSLVQVH